MVNTQTFPGGGDLASLERPDVSQDPRMPALNGPKRFQTSVRSNWLSPIYPGASLQVGSAAT